MTMTDPVADMLTRVRNANIVQHDQVDVPASKVKLALADILKKEGFIRDYEFRKDNKQGLIRLYLKYSPERERVITGLKKISKPGLRVYVKNDELPKVLGGLGIAIISTSSGLMSDKDARKSGVGGEVLCYVW